MRWSFPLTAALAVALPSLLLPATAEAFVYKTSQAGAPVHWAPGQVAVDIQLEDLPQVAGDPVAATRAALATWNDALAGSGIELVEVPGAANVIRWATDASDPALEPGKLAVTQVTYRPGDGVILPGAIIVVDAVHYHWSAGGAECHAENDLQTLLTHELGHLIGMAHTVGHPEATMDPAGHGCDISRRQLADDDRSGVVSLYSDAFEDDQGGCSIGMHRGGGSPWLFFAILGGIFYAACARPRPSPATSGRGRARA
jgi:hypothetical protein